MELFPQELNRRDTLLCGLGKPINKVFLDF